MIANIERANTERAELRTIQQRVNDIFANQRYCDRCCGAKPAKVVVRNIGAGRFQYTAICDRCDQRSATQRHRGAPPPQISAPAPKRITLADMDARIRQIEGQPK